MKAISLTQPWATLVAIGAKRIETRSWRTNYRGPLAIHASVKFPKDAYRLCFIDNDFYTALGGREGNIVQIANTLPRGAVLATCRLADCVPAELIRGDTVFAVSIAPIGYPEVAFGDYSDGRFAWVLEDVRKLAEPIPAKGALGLWNWEAPHGSR